MDFLKADERRVGRWYFGGVAGSMAACFTHPLDLLKVQLQTQQQGKVSLVELSGKILKSDGVRGFYNGLSASLMRQLTYTTTRFAVYETVKNHWDGEMNFMQKMLLAGIAGACGGVAGSPADLVNVRMQNDIKLAPAERRNYKNAIDGLIRMRKEEGIAKWFNGCTMATGRAVLMTIGQLSFYDQIKQMLISANLAKDNIYTHLFSSFLAASGATVLTQPMDVLKTRMMNAQPGQFKGLWDCCVYTAKLGPAGFYKGFFPAWVRLAPHTILLFVFFEQLRQRCGYLPEGKSAAAKIAIHSAPSNKMEEKSPSNKVEEKSPSNKVEEESPSNKMEEKSASSSRGRN